MGDESVGASMAKASIGAMAASHGYGFPLPEKAGSSVATIDSLPRCPECHRAIALQEDGASSCVCGWTDRDGSSVDDNVFPKQISGTSSKAASVCPTARIKGPLEDEIRQKCQEMAEFLVAKNRAYGNSVGEPVGVFAKRLDKLAQMDVRLDDKISRLQKGAEYPGDDTVKDLAGYLILRMIIAEMEVN